MYEGKIKMLGRMLRLLTQSYFPGITNVAVPVPFCGMHQQNSCVCVCVCVCVREIEGCVCVYVHKLYYSLIMQSLLLKTTSEIKISGLLPGISTCEPMLNLHVLCTPYHREPCHVGLCKTTSVGCMRVYL